MSENAGQSINLLYIAIFTGLFLYFVGLFSHRKDVMSRSVFRYIYTPLAFLPTFVLMTYAIWPGNRVSFITRVFVALVIVVLAVGRFYVIWQPFAKRISPSYKKYVEEGDKD